MSSTNQDKSYFLAFCIEQYKASKGMDGAEVARLFFENGVADYLLDNFEVLHTQSRQWLMEKIDDILKQIDLLLLHTPEALKLLKFKESHKIDLTCNSK